MHAIPPPKKILVWTIFDHIWHFFEIHISMRVDFQNESFWQFFGATKQTRHIVKDISSANHHSLVLGFGRFLLTFGIFLQSRLQCRFAFKASHLGKFLASRSKHVTLSKISRQRIIVLWLWVLVHFWSHLLFFTIQIGKLIW